MPGGVDSTSQMGDRKIMAKLPSYTSIDIDIANKLATKLWLSDTRMHQNMDSSMGFASLFLGPLEVAMV